jgi:beta-glucosidase
MATEKGYIIGVAPPQSYLDSQNSKFSRAVNLVDNDRMWHRDFHYFGSNVYAYLLAKYGDYLDFISVQFYESYSRAAMSILGPDNRSAASYFEMYVNDLASKDFSIFIEFENDPSSGLSNQWVPIPLHKLVFGFANGWALDTEGKALFVQVNDVALAYQNLRRNELDPRGFMFWVIGEEGRNDVQYAASLNKILTTRRVVSPKGSVAEL